MQSKTESFVESMLNTASGFVLSLFLVNTVLPFYGFDVKPGQSLEIVMIFYSCICLSQLYLEESV